MYIQKGYLITMDYRTKWARFEASSMREKLAIFKRLYGCSGEHLNAVLLGELVKVRLQEIQFGELTPAEEARLEAVCSHRDYTPPHRGEILRRTYRGRLYEVERMENGGFRYGTKVYRSLTAVAREITGSATNGLRFFNVSSATEQAR